MYDPKPTLFDLDPGPNQYGLTQVIPFIQTKVAKTSRISAEFLLATDIDAFIDIQNKIRPFLAQPHHLKERSAEDVLAHLAERMPLIGARAYTDEMNSGSVVAGCLLSFLKNHDEENTAIKNLNGYPVHPGEYPVTALVQSLCVDPAFERRGISQIILDVARYSAQQHGMTQIISAIADDNEGSIGTFTKAGYKDFAKGTDPFLGYAKTFYRLQIA